MRKIIIKLLNNIEKISFRLNHYYKAKRHILEFGWMSETSKCRDRLAKYCIGNGLDIGHGGDPINDTAITLDMDQPTSDYGFRKTNFIAIAQKR